MMQPDRSPALGLAGLPTLAGTLGRALALASALASALAFGTAAVAAGVDAPWTVVGRQGILIHVIVPAEHARDREAYERQIELICGAAETCFVNFYTNSTGATPALPLPDAISGEATAVLRRSAKQGTEGFRFSCRMGLPVADCF